MDNWFGKFDLLFVGALINCDTPPKVKAVHRFLKGESDSHYLDLFSAQNVQELTEIIWYNTTFIHESRHVHDYLLFPSLNTEYYHRLLSVLFTVNSLNYGSIIGDKLGYNVLPIPLTKWFHSDRAAQLEMLNEWSDNGFSASAPLVTLPNPSVPRTKSYEQLIDSLDLYTKGLVWGNTYYMLDNALRTFKSVDQYDRAISIKSLLEASAIAVQVYAAESLYGDTGINLINETIRDAQLYETYPSRRFTEYSTVFSRVYYYMFYHKTLNVYYFIPFVSILMCWCFCGNVFERGSYNPVHRFRAFINEDFGKGLSFADIIQDPLGVFARWDNLYGHKPLNMAEYNLKQRARYEQLYQACKENGLKEVAAYVEMIAKASQRMNLIYMDNPLNYILPNKYLEQFSLFTNIPICYSIKKGIEDFSDLHYANDLSKQGYYATGDTADHFFVTINVPKIKLKIGETALCYQHEELKPEISAEFVRYGKLTEAIHGETTDEYNYDILNRYISPQEVRFVF